MLFVPFNPLFDTSLLFYLYISTGIPVFIWSVRSASYPLWLPLYIKLVKYQILFVLFKSEYNDCK